VKAGVDEIIVDDGLVVLVVWCIVGNDDDAVVVDAVLIDDETGLLIIRRGVAALDTKLVASVDIEPSAADDDDRIAEIAFDFS
jgi:hypothetical protein